MQGHDCSQVRLRRFTVDMRGSTARGLWKCRVNWMGGRGTWEPRELVGNKRSRGHVAKIAELYREEKLGRAGEV